MTTLSKTISVFCLALLLAGAGPSARAEEENPLPELIAELAPPIARSTLEQIPDLSRRMLALRSYLRAGKRIERRWSWTEKEIKDFQGTDEQTELLVAIDAVSAHFAEANPGYELYANTRVRSLDLQIRRWNANKSVGVTADELMTATLEQFGLDSEPEAVACKPAAVADGKDGAEAKAAETSKASRSSRADKAERARSLRKAGKAVATKTGRKRGKRDTAEAVGPDGDDGTPEVDARTLRSRSLLKAGKAVLPDRSRRSRRAKLLDDLAFRAEDTGKTAAKRVAKAAEKAAEAEKAEETGKAETAEREETDKKRSVAGAEETGCSEAEIRKSERERKARMAARKRKRRRLNARSLRTWLARFAVTKAANLAAPGMSSHGQARAIDFQIMKDGKIFAGAASSMIEPTWRAGGWDKKLKVSIVAASPAFSGPLIRPDEPWHYNYDPDAPVKITVASASAIARDSTRSEPVQFGDGTIRATVTGKIKGKEIVDYVLGASAGQKMRVSLSAELPSTFFNVLAPGDDTKALFIGTLKGKAFETVLRASGIYKIRVYSVRSADLARKAALFSLEMAISAK